MAPLAADNSLDGMVVLQWVTGDTTVAAIGGGSAFVLLISVWFAYPQLMRRKLSRIS
jgi:hypothetical protein